MISEGDESSPALSTKNANDFLLLTSSILVDLFREISIMGMEAWKYHSTLSGKIISVSHGGTAVILNDISIRWNKYEAYILLCSHMYFTICQSTARISKRMKLLYAMLPALLHCLKLDCISGTLPTLAELSLEDAANN